MKPSKALQAKWNKKLKASGFKDIEQEGSPYEYLKTWDSQYFLQRYTPLEFASEQRYFELGSQFLETHVFNTTTEKAIFAAHVDGLSNNDIARKRKLSAWKVAQIIKPVVAKMLNKLKLRRLEPNDMSFIYSTFLRGLYYGSEQLRQMERATFFKEYEAVLLKLLAKPSCELLIACLSDEPDIILGWACLEPKVGLLHYCYVKEAWRQQGIAKLLTAHSELSIVTHITKLGNKIRKAKGWAYNPLKV